MSYTSIKREAYPEGFATIAHEYLTKNKSSTGWSIFGGHNSHEFADSLKDLQKRECTDVEKWVSMCIIYIRMNNPSGTLAKKMRSLVSSIYPEETVESLHKKLLFELGGHSQIYHAIGQEYLDSYPKIDSGVLGYGSHTHQEHAQAIKAAKNDYQGAAFWVYLYHKYKKVNCTGKLANSIANVFETHFRDSMKNIISTLDLDSFSEDLEDAKKIAIKLESADEKRWHIKILEDLHDRSTNTYLSGSNESNSKEVKVI
ncbi:hypothetical protein [Legionella sp. W05-934-2]|uniref:hypothetical protein n=1 Tax=Legionella sp. W05-934-2 TaxID=1198649 RepID=UPI0034630D01